MCVIVENFDYFQTEKDSGLAVILWSNNWWGTDGYNCWGNSEDGTLVVVLLLKMKDKAGFAN